MMSKTHIAIGVASSIALSQPKTIAECLRAILGGAVGSLVCDIDVKSNANLKSRDALYGRIMAVIVVAMVLIIDFIMKAGIWENVLEVTDAQLMAGTVAFGLICLIARNSSHRGFSHSFLALILLSVSLSFICMSLVVYFAIGFLSHLVLDVLNKKPIRLFFPWGKGICLKIFYADGTANTVFLIIGLCANLLFFAQILM